MRCDKCENEAVTLLRYANLHLCASHFAAFVEKRVKHEFHSQVELEGGERITIGLSGGKDSSTATYLMGHILGSRRDIELVAITVDEGIQGYRPLSIPLARELCRELGIEHHIVSYEETLGWQMDDVVNLDPPTIPCSYCGVFRRQVLNIKAKELGADFLVTGLNLDDTAQSILMNVARGDVEKLARLGPHRRVQQGLVPRLQPLRTIPEKEVYLYAFIKGIKFHEGTCPYAERAQRGRFREILNRLEDETPGTRHAILSGYEELRPMLQGAYPPAELMKCGRCGEPTMHRLCKACELRTRLEDLARGLAKT